MWQPRRCPGAPRPAGSAGDPGFQRADQGSCLAVTALPRVPARHGTAHLGQPLLALSLAWHKGTRREAAPATRGLPPSPPAQRPRSTRGGSSGRAATGPDSPGEAVGRCVPAPPWSRTGIWGCLFLTQHRPHALAWPPPGPARRGGSPREPPGGSAARVATATGGPRPALRVRGRGHLICMRAPGWLLPRRATARCPRRLRGRAPPPRVSGDRNGPGWRGEGAAARAGPCHSTWHQKVLQHLQ